MPEPDILYKTNRLGKEGELAQQGANGEAMLEPDARESMSLKKIRIQIQIPKPTRIPEVRARTLARGGAAEMSFPTCP